jgi:alanyl-tRNA synthetase
MNHLKVREKFTSYFRERDHVLVKPSGIIPIDDPTLLFTNAGMNQFKDVLLGREKRTYQRAISIQPCMRVGGKHNDLDNVGKDGRHNTWFEMLGNWSFGDYYKLDAIAFAWELVTKGYGVDASRLYASIYKDDEDSRAAWKKVAGLPDSRIVRLGDIAVGDEENFWSMGPTGPCGPCTELYYDQGESLGEDTIGGKTDRYLEFWNLVFMEFDRAEDGSLTPLAQRSVDTGMGLERICAITSGKTNVFHTDLFMPLIKQVQEISGRPFEGSDAAAFCVIADHARALTFVLADHGKFDRAGRGYVLRRILRRAVMYGKKLGISEPFLNRLVNPTIDSLQVYDVPPAQRAAIERMILAEEERFLATIDRGLAYFHRAVDSARVTSPPVIPGDVAFQLYDTFGFPIDLTQILAEEQRIDVDMAGFESALDVQRDKSRRSQEFYDKGGWVVLDQGMDSGFLGHGQESHPVNILRWRSVDDSHVELVLDKTPFYPEGGGELADAGALVGAGVELSVEGVKRTDAGVVHSARLVGGSPDAFRGRLHANVDLMRRAGKAAHHTATHLLHAALRAIFGDATRQMGSLVAPDRLRFDFALDRAVSDHELVEVERMVNQWILEDHEVEQLQNVLFDDAKRRGALAFFGEKYGERVRVIEIPGVSVELCGGTHVSRTARIGSVQIIAEQGIAAGTRRIEAVAHFAAVHQARAMRSLLEELARSLSVPREQLSVRIARVLDDLDQLRRTNAKLLDQGAGMPSVDELLASAVMISGIPVVLKVIENRDPKSARKLLDSVHGRWSEGFVILVSVTNREGLILIGAGKGVVAGGRVDAVKVARAIGKRVGSGGGGRPTFAQTGYKGYSADQILEVVGAAVEESIGGD